MAALNVRGVTQGPYLLAANAHLLQAPELPACCSLLHSSPQHQLHVQESRLV